MNYQIFFNLDDAPFRLTPDPAYFFPSKRHNEALETLIYSVDSGEGFVQITGEPGVGKTLLIRSFLDQIGDDVNTALILHPRLSAADLFKVILEDLGLAPENMEKMTKETLLRSFRDILLRSAEEGKKTLVIIDEAQEVPEETLEELRLLSNLETEEKKLLQIILVGQRELEQKLNHDSLRQLKQRITIRYRLDSLTYDETVNYIQHRLKIAGSGNMSRFSPKIIKRIHRISNGTPRIINSLCERALMAAFVDGKSSVNQKHLDNALQSLQGEQDTLQQSLYQTKHILIYGVVLLLGLCMALYFTNAPFRRFLQQKSARTMTLLQTLKETFAGNNPVKREKTAQRETRQNGQDRQADQKRIAPVTSSGTRNATDTMAAGKSHQSNNVSGTMQALSYGAIIALPTGWKSIIISRQDDTAILFQGDDSARPAGTLDLPATPTLKNGIYLLGTNKDTPYLFNPRAFFSWQVDRPLAKWLWQQFGNTSDLALIPVIVTDVEQLPTTKKDDEATIPSMVKDWAESFNRKDLKKFMEYYDDSLLTYRLFRNRPTVKNHSEITADKEAVVKKNGAFTLQVSDPVCLINPNDPSQAMAIFYQRFISSKYSDSFMCVVLEMNRQKNT